MGGLGPFNSRHLTSEGRRLCPVLSLPRPTIPLNCPTTPLRIWPPTRPISMLAAIRMLVAVCHRLLLLLLLLLLHFFVFVEFQILVLE